MNPKKLKFYCFTICLLICITFRAQNDAAYLLLDSKIGLENTMLFSGIQNLDSEVTVNNKTKYLFNNEDFIKSSIMYNENYYPNVLLKFNVYDDLVLVKIPVETKFSTFQLITSRIQSFEMEGKEFENIGLESNKDFDGFYEKLMVNSAFILYKKHKKKMNRILDRDYSYFEFESADANYIFKYEGKFHDANSKSEIVSVLDSQKGTIKKFYSNKRFLLRSNPDDFMIELFKTISSSAKFE